MSHVLFSDDPVCKLMAEKAMYDPTYKLRLEASASGKKLWMNPAIETDMTNFRHKLLMLSKIEITSHQHQRGTLKAQINGDSKCAVLSAGRAAANSRRALKILAENQRLLTNPKPFPLLRLPLELRQQIYEEVLKGTNPTVVVKSFDISAFQDDQQNRDIETFYGNRASPHWENPVSTFQNATPNIYGKDITTGLLLACKSIYTEAIPILYQGRMFDFGVDVFGIVPFLRKMTPLARQNVQNIHMEFYDLPTLVHKRGTTTLLRHHWHVRGNTQDWTETCAYITNHLQLKNLSINVNMEVSKPTDPPVDLPRLKWVQDLVQIRELQQLSYHVSSHGHGLKDMGPRGAMRLRDAISVPSQLGSDAVDGDVKGAQPGLGKLFGYLRGEMLGMSTESGRGFETGA